MAQSSARTSIYPYKHTGTIPFSGIIENRLGCKHIEKEATTISARKQPRFANAAYQSSVAPLAGGITVKALAVVNDVLRA